jgi:nicotinamide riboside kinase
MKIAFTGPESCGKSTMAKWCAEFHQLPLSEEYAREYLENQEAYNLKDLDVITIAQLNDWEKKGSKFVADTEMTVMKIWSEFRFQKLSPLIQMAYTNQQFDHYFLCAPDIPWEADPLRENPMNRLELFGLYEKELKENNRPYTILKGTLIERQKQVQFVLNR